MTERKRSYKVGHRRGASTVGKPKDRLSRSRWAWVTVYFGQLVIWAEYKKNEEGEETDELQDLKLLEPIQNRPSVTWNLTSCTEEELVALKELIDTAFEWALPIVRERDKEAQDAFENGDDSHGRIYRQVPKLVYRTGPESQHGEGVQHGDGGEGPGRRTGRR